MSPRTILCALTVASLLAVDVHAQNAPDNRKVYEEGYVHFRQGRYHLACERFLALWRNGAYPGAGGLALALAQCHRQQSQWTRALYFFEVAANNFNGASPWLDVIREQLLVVFNNLTRVQITLPTGVRSVTLDGQDLARVELSKLRALRPDLGGPGPLNDGCLADVVALGGPHFGPRAVESHSECVDSDGVHLYVVLSSNEKHTLELGLVGVSTRAITVIEPAMQAPTTGGGRLLVDATRSPGRMLFTVATNGVAEDEIRLKLRPTARQSDPQTTGGTYVPDNARLETKMLPPGGYSLQWFYPDDVELDAPKAARGTIELAPGQHYQSHVKFTRQERDFVGSPLFWTLVAVAGVTAAGAVMCATGLCTTQEEPDLGSLNWRIEVPK